MNIYADGFCWAVALIVIGYPVIIIGNAWPWTLWFTLPLVLGCWFVNAVFDALYPEGV